MIINSHIFVLFICSLTKKGDLPEGFFDDPKIDAKVRIPCSSRCSGVVDGVLHRYGKWSTWTHRRLSGRSFRRACRRNLR